MKNLKLILLLFLLPLTLVAGYSSDLTENFQLGDPEIQSMNAMAFGPEGILFIGDSKSASVIAIDTETKARTEKVEAINMSQVDETIAALVGTTADNISIQDIAVDPASKMIYFAVHLKDGTPVLLKTDGKVFTYVSLEKIRYSKIELAKAVAEDAKDGRGRSLRQWAISDMGYHNGNVLVTGLSNEEFSSTFRSIPFPFKEKQIHASLEIYHAAHGRYETYAPIKTFMPYEFNGESYLVASYTCTPLVLFPMSEIKPGQHSKGKTIAELGNRNTPLDIISYTKEDKPYILLANSSRALMKLDPDKMLAYKEFLTTPVEENSATAGVDFIALPYVNVLQMDKFDDSHVLLLQRKANGNLDLFSADSGRL